MIHCQPGNTITVIGAVNILGKISLPRSTVESRNAAHSPEPYDIIFVDRDVSNTVIHQAVFSRIRLPYRRDIPVRVIIHGNALGGSEPFFVIPTHCDRRNVIADKPILFRKYSPAMAIQAENTFHCSKPFDVIVINGASAWDKVNIIRTF
ncbi:MAG: hypothetical protein PHQ42_00980 [Patescibacteria group bacterium]|nr:hypothetical protein [Patescibacteria group bacterium]